MDKESGIYNNGATGEELSRRDGGSSSGYSGISQHHHGSSSSSGSSEHHHSSSSSSGSSEHHHSSSSSSGSSEHHHSSSSSGSSEHHHSSSSSSGSSEHHHSSSSSSGSSEHHHSSSSSSGSSKNNKKSKKSKSSKSSGSSDDNKKKYNRFVEYIKNLPKKTKKKIILAFVLVVVIAAVVWGISKWESGHYNLGYDEDAQVVTSFTEDMPQIFYNERWYTAKENIETILLLGVDKYENQVRLASYNAQQTDFILLVVIDNDAKTYAALQLNRDTMAEFDILSATGDTAGTTVAQLALAHAYGSGGSDSCRNTVKAVSNLLYGIDVQHYMSITMDGVAVINDAVGGVEVTIEDDFSNVDTSLVQGETVTLKGEHALTFVRARREMEDSSNLARMNRQKVYLEALMEKWEQEDEDTLLDVLFDISDYMVSDCSIYMLSDYFEAVKDYEFLGFLVPEGTAKSGEEFIEFTVDESDLRRLVVDLFYQETDN